MSFIFWGFARGGSSAAIGGPAIPGQEVGPVKRVRVEDSAGAILCHDLTKIVPGEFKGAAFRKGHIIREEDIPELLKMGKAHIFVWEQSPGLLHEDEAAIRIARAAVGSAETYGITLSDPREGKVNLVAAIPGLLKVNVDALDEVNSIDQIAFSTRHGNTPVTAGAVLAGTRVIPMVIEESAVRAVEDICAREGGLIQLKPFREMRAGIITTGSEVLKGRIVDRFGPAVEAKVKKYGSSVIKQVYVGDDAGAISASIKEMAAAGVELILVTGGMSVDPDDVTPLGIRQTGAEVVTYGSPVLPGSMFMLAYLGELPIMGLPGCVMYESATIFDLVLPRVLAGERVTRKEIVRLGHGGLCLRCAECRFPDCSFGKR